MSDRRRILLVADALAALGMAAACLPAPAHLTQRWRPEPEPEADPAADKAAMDRAEAKRERRRKRRLAGAVAP